MIRCIDWLERGEGVMPEDILAAEERCGFTIEGGRCIAGSHRQPSPPQRGRPRQPARSRPPPACQAACLPLFHERGIAVLGSDTGNDVMPSQCAGMPNPICQVGIVAIGLWILDNPNLEELAAESQKRSRREFMLSINPLRLFNATGSPVNPIAIF